MSTPKTVEDQAKGTETAKGGGGEPKDIDETQGQSGSQTDTKEEKMGPDNLAPELEDQRKELMKDYHSKLKSSRDEVQKVKAESARDKNDADQLWKLSKNPRFMTWMKDEKSRRDGNVGTGITDEELEAAASDPKALRQLFEKSGKAITKQLRADFEADMHGLKKNQESLASERELQKVSSKWDDFKELNDAGFLDPYLEQNPNLEQAYKSYKFDQGDIPEKVREEATKQINSKKNSAVSKGGVPSGKGELVLKAKNFDDAFDQVFTHLMAGKKVSRVEKA